MITPLEAVLFGVLALMVLAWFAGVAKLSRRLRERHPAKYEQMGLEFMWPQNLGQWLSGYNNSGPVFALLRFLWRREDAELGDLEISSQTTFLRWHFALYLILFTALVTSILRGAWVMEVRQKQAAIEVANRPEYRRERVFGPAREKRWADTIAAYDALQPESGKDAELTYWRGMAHWGLGRGDQALQDFRRAIELDPAYFDAIRYADRLLSQQQRWDEILELWDRYIDKSPANAEAYFERGGTHFHKGNLAAAQADAAKACELGKAEACAMSEKLKARLPQ